MIWELEWGHGPGEIAMPPHQPCPDILVIYEPRHVLSPGIPTDASPCIFVMDDGGASVPANF